MTERTAEARLLRNLVDGLVGWATYYQAMSARAHYSEALFYLQIESIARSRGWKVRQQHPLLGLGATGAPSTLDFVFYRRPNKGASAPGLAFVEVKYLRGKNRSQDLGYLWGDIEKLRDLTPTGLKLAKTLSACGPPAKFLLVVGQMSALRSTARCKTRTPAKQEAARLLGMAMRKSPPAGIYWCEANTYQTDDYDWRAMAISSRRWPDAIADDSN